MRYKKIIQSILFILLIPGSIPCFSQTHTLKIVKSELHAINRELKTKNIKDESFEIEANKLGKIISVKSGQQPLVEILNEKYIVPEIEDKQLIPENYLIEIKKRKLKKYKIFNPANDTIKGQIVTAITLTGYMRSKKYREGTELFSKKQQKYIMGIQHKL